MILKRVTVAGFLFSLGACVSPAPESQMPVPAWSVSVGAPAALAEPVASAADDADEYVAIPDNAAHVLGCLNASSLPICSVAEPNAAESAAFRAEGARLQSHADSRCRRLGVAITTNENGVRMYRKALVKSGGPYRLYGVGHAYVVDDIWLVRVARRLDDLNERSIEEKTRTLRHEMSHTIGATETPGSGWTAEDYATHCG